jgi:hypothetical protein
LALGAGATVPLSAVQGGLPALGPTIQDSFGLTLVEVTAVFTAFGLGVVVTLLAWAVLAEPDRRAARDRSRPRRRGLPIYTSDGVTNNASAKGMVAYRARIDEVPRRRDLVDHLNPQTMDHDMESEGG